MMQATTVTPIRNRMALSAVRSGRIESPLRIFLYGVEKIGKSSWASEAPKPIYLCPEVGTEQLDIARFPEPHDWDDVLAAVGTLIGEPHDYKTVVLDTVDWLAALLYRKLIELAPPNNKGYKAKNIEELHGGYGKGYKAAVSDGWRPLIAKLEKLRAVRGMHVILLGHSMVKAFNNPLGDNYDRYEPKLSKDESGFLKEWVDDLLFCNYDTATVKADGGGKSKGIGYATRFVHTTRCAAYDAGNRHSLPERLPLDWDAYLEAVKAGRPASAEALLAEIRKLTDGRPEYQARAEAGIKVCDGKASRLARLLDKVRATIATGTQE